MKSKRIYGRAYAGRDGADNIFGQTCSICLESFKGNDVVTVVKPCNHAYHWFCLEGYVSAKIREAIRYPRRTVEIQCPEDRADILFDGHYNFARVPAEGSLLQALPPDVEAQYVFAWDLRKKWYCPSVAGAGSQGFAGAGLERNLASLREQATLNTVGLLHATRNKDVARSDGSTLMHYFPLHALETIQRYTDDVNKYMRCSNRPFLNPYRSVQDFWGWVLTNIEALTMEERGDDREYSSFVWRLFEDIHEPYKALVTIPQYFSPDFDVFTRGVLHSRQWHLFMSTVLLLMIVSNVKAHSLLPLVRDLNRATEVRSVARVREVCAELGRYTT